MERTLFLELLQVSIGVRDQLSRTPSEEEWKWLLLRSFEMEIGGIMYTGVERLPREQRPDIAMLLEWSKVVDNIEKENQKLNKTTLRVCQNFRSEGIRMCVLKGQAVGAWYDNPLRRNAGDIDVWMDGGHEFVEEYVKKNISSHCEVGLKHVSVTLANGVEMEVHHTPASMYSRKHHTTLWRWLDAQSQKQWGNTQETYFGVINSPTAGFNKVYLLLHYFFHWAFEGAGLKQMVDYYYCLKTDVDTNDDDIAPMEILSSIGLDRFAQAIMWIMREVFMLPQDKLICIPDERLGKLLINDILDASCQDDSAAADGGSSFVGALRKFIMRTRRLLRVYPLAPRELGASIYHSVRGYLK